MSEDSVRQKHLAHEPKPPQISTRRTAAATCPWIEATRSAPSPSTSAPAPKAPESGYNATMSRRFHDCPGCACLIAVEDTLCIFCGAPQRFVAAPVWLTAALVGGLAGLACDERDRPTEFRSGSSTGSTDTTGGGTTSDTTGTSTGSTGSGTTLDPSDTFSDASTYGGPDESTLTDPGPPATTSGDSTGPQPESGGSTYAGPDEFTTTVPTTDAPALPETLDDSGAPGAGDSSTSDDAESTAATGEEQQSSKDGCACNGDARPPGTLLGLFGLLALRRRLR